MEQSRQDRPRYLEWIKAEINTAIDQINRFDKIALLGGLSVKLIKSTPNLYMHFLARGEEEDAAEVEDKCHRSPVLPRSTGQHIIRVTVRSRSAFV